MTTRQQKIKALVRLLEKQSGKKVKFLKEVDEASKNQAVNNLQFIESSLTNCIEKINELYDLPMFDQQGVEVGRIHQILVKTSDRVSALISKVTGVTSEEQLEEDVTMTTDEIIKDPTTVKKLADKKIDVRVKNNKPGSNSTSSSSNISMSSATF